VRFREFCNFPIVLLGVAENRIDISIAVCVGEIHITKLLTLDITSGFLASDNTIRLARIFKALSYCRKDLTCYYDEIGQETAPKLSSLFPKPTPMDPSVVLPVLTYKQFLSRTGQPASALVDLGKTNTAMYIATLDGADEEVVVKFTPRYNAKAHSILANAGFAPKLHFCGRVVGGLYMVVMDRVDGKSLWQLQQTRHRFLLLSWSMSVGRCTLSTNKILYWGTCGTPTSSTSRLRVVQLSSTLIGLG
jgi:hypothetical protein